MSDLRELAQKATPGRWDSLEPLREGVLALLAERDALAEALEARRIWIAQMTEALEKMQGERDALVASCAFTALSFFSDCPAVEEGIAHTCGHPDAHARNRAVLAKARGESS